jgi:hypothetical protein
VRRTVNKNSLSLTSSQDDLFFGLIHATRPRQIQDIYSFIELINRHSQIRNMYSFIKLITGQSIKLPRPIRPPLVDRLQFRVRPLRMCSRSRYKYLPRHKLLQVLGRLRFKTPWVQIPWTPIESVLPFLWNSKIPRMTHAADTSRESSV